MVRVIRLGSRASTFRAGMAFASGHSLHELRKVGREDENVSFTRNLLVFVDDESSMIHISAVSQFHQCR